MEKKNYECKSLSALDLMVMKPLPGFVGVQKWLNECKSLSLLDMVVMNDLMSEKVRKDGWDGQGPGVLIFQPQ